MKTTAFIMVSALAFLLVATFIANKMKRKRQFNYTQKPELLNKTEQVLLARLGEAMPNLLIFAQVSMSQLFQFRNSFVPNEVARKSVDFLICRKDTSIICAIEMNGPTHKNEARMRSDATKKAAMDSAGIPLIIYTPDNMPNAERIKNDIAPLMIRKTEERKRGFQK